MTKKNGFMIYILSFTAFLIIPVLIVLTLSHALFTTDRFYTGIIKQMNLVEQIITAKNFEIENDIKREIEKRTGINAFKPEYEKIKKNYEESLASFNAFYRTEEYNRIRNQISELDKLKWIKSSDEFKSKDEFELFKKNKLAELKGELKGIDDYRKLGRDQVRLLEKELDVAEGDLKKAEKDMKSREKEAGKILKSRQNEFLNTIYADIHKISPVLTERLNTLFIDAELKNLINRYLDFLMSHDRQLQEGNVYTQRFDIDSGMIENLRVVKLPPLRISMRVKTEDGAERHLLSGVFVKSIGTIPGLSNPWIITKIFSMSDSWFIEKYARGKLRSVDMTISNGVISSGGPVTLKGDPAVITEYAMLFMTYGKYLKYITPAVILFFIFTILFSGADRKSGARFAGRVLKYQAYIFIILSAAVIITAFKPSWFLPGFGTDPVSDTLKESVIFAAASHTFIPVILIFTGVLMAGIILYRLGREGKA